MPATIGARGGHEADTLRLAQVQGRLDVAPIGQERGALDPLHPGRLRPNLAPPLRGDASPALLRIRAFFGHFSGGPRAVSGHLLPSVDAMTTRRSRMQFTTLSKLIRQSFEHEMATTAEWPGRSDEPLLAALHVRE